jgi:aminoglycoside phosphotransferase (APT) family kinase protein
VVHGYADYCVIDSLRNYSPESRGLLERLQALAENSTGLSCSTSDIVHYDFTAANILIDAGEISGISDWDGAQPGDRAFDLATLLFYAADQPEAAALLWEAAVARSSAEAIRLYLAHMIVRQVDWSIRHHGERGSRHALAHGLSIERRYLTVTKRRPALL